MNKGKSIAYLLIGLLVGLLLGYLFGERPAKISGEVTKEVFVDTIPYVDLVPVDSNLARVDIVTLPIIEPPTPPKENLITEVIQDNEQRIDTLMIANCMENPPDSAMVAVPISQYEFSDSTYNLKVSGFHVSLDEMTLYPRREVVAIKQSPKRWHLGISAGYGITPKGMQPVVALTLSYSLLSF